MDSSEAVENADAVAANAEAETPLELQGKEALVLPYIHKDGEEKICDFCGSSRKTQVFSFDVVGSVRTLRVCPASKCDGRLTESRIAFYEAEGRIPLEAIADTVPSLVDPKKEWNVVRTSTEEVEKGWKVPRSWRVSPDLGCLYRLRGEPWYRIALVRGDKLKLVLLDDLRAANPNALAPDVWEMLLTAVLPQPESEPSDEFLNYYPAKVWNMACPGDVKLLELRI